MRKFFTVEDVEHAASRGERSIAIAAEDIITAMAMERAEALGIAFALQGAGAPRKYEATADTGRVIETLTEA